MRSGNVHKFGDVVLATIQFIDTFETKVRPAVVLFEEYNNVVVAGITSNTAMKGVILTKKDGAISDSVIKANYIFTISGAMIKKFLFTLSESKQKELCSEITKKLRR